MALSFLPTNPSQALGATPMIATLTREQMQYQAPSIFATSPWHTMSNRYKYVPTIEVVDMLADRGFRPVRVMQSKSRIEGKSDFTRHLIRFRHEAHLNTFDQLHVGDEFPELVLTNSHDGTSCYCFDLGLFRLVCSNGAVVASSDLESIKIRHKGGNDFEHQVIDAPYRLMDESPKIVDTVSTWKQIPLTPAKQLALAAAALELRESDALINPAGLLAARRYEDKPDQNGNRSLWTTFNVLQESMIRGGVRGRSQSGRRMTTRAIKGVDADLRTNRALWRLAEEMAKLA
jgi:hypothetical protein